VSDLAALVAADRARALELTPVSRETIDRLDRFVETLLAWQATTNLIAPSTVPHLWTRHVADSLQLLAFASDARIWVDVGSGGGFPGLVLACALADRADGRVELVESNAKKAAFLREAIRASGARAAVHAERIEGFVGRYRGAPHVVTCRALAPLDILLGWIAPLMKRGAQALLLKGQDLEA
jgi:16S rRNA (guanine527-N7)-methyltransferase